MEIKNCCCIHIHINNHVYIYLIWNNKNILFTRTRARKMIFVPYRAPRIIDLHCKFLYPVMVSEHVMNLVYLAFLELSNILRTS